MLVVCMMSDGRLDCISGYADVGVLRKRGDRKRILDAGFNNSPPSGGVIISHSPNKVGDH